MLIVFNNKVFVYVFDTAK